MTISPSCVSISRRSPLLSPMALTISPGSRMARFFPHLPTVTCDTPSSISLGYSYHIFLENFRIQPSSPAAAQQPPGHARFGWLTTGPAVSFGDYTSVKYTIALCSRTYRELAPNSVLLLPCGLCE